MFEIFNHTIISEGELSNLKDSVVAKAVAETSASYETALSEASDKARLTNILTTACAGFASALVMGLASHFEAKKALKQKDDANKQLLQLVNDLTDNVKSLAEKQATIDVSVQTLLARGNDEATTVDDAKADEATTVDDAKADDSVIDDDKI